MVGTTPLKSTFQNGGEVDRAQLETLWRRALELRPPGWIARPRFDAFVLDRMNAAAPTRPDPSTLRASDLYLACACADRHPEALRAFETELIPAVRAELRARGVPEAELDEVLQRVRTRLLLSARGEVARIGTYAGRGDLRRWVRAAALRIYLNLLRAAPREVPVDDSRILDAVAHEARDPELAHMRDTYRREVESAFAEGLAELSVEHRLVLRYRYVDCLPVERLAAALGVHRATAHRKLNRACERLATATLSALRKKVELNDSDFASVLRLIRSQIDLGLSRALGAAEAGC